MEVQGLSTLEVSLYAHIYDKHVEFKNLDNTTDLTIDKYKFYEGHVVVEFKDHRQNPSCDGKRQLLRKNDDSLWNDVLRLNQSTGSSWTYEQAIQIEAKLLGLLHPNLDLNPNSIPEWIIPADPAKSSESNTMPTHRKLKKRKRKPNSSEKEEEKAKRTKNEKMMFMMDERHNKEFKPEFRLAKYFNQKISTNDEAPLPPIIDKGKKKIDADEIKRLEAKKSLGKRTRSVRFERDCLSITAEGQKSVDKFYKVQTLINVYCDRKKYTVIVHTLDERELKATGEFSKFVRMVDGARYYIKLDDTKAFLKYEFHTKNEYLSFIEAFIILYGMDNKIKHDSEKISLSTAQELAEDYSKKQFVLEIVKAKQPHQIVEFLAQKPPSEVVQSPFEFKFNNQNIKIQSIPDLVTATSIKESQQSEILVVDNDRIAMPPPSLPQHKRNLINNQQISSQIQSSLFSESTQTSTQSNNYQSLLSFQQNHQSSLYFQIPVQLNNNHQSPLQTPEQLSFQTLIQSNNHQSPLQTPIKSNSYQSFLSSQIPVQRHQSPSYLQTPVQYNNNQYPLSFQIPAQSNNHQSFPSSQTVQPNSHQSLSSSFQTQSPLSFQTPVIRPPLSFETLVQSNNHQSPSSFQTSTPIQSNSQQLSLSSQTPIQSNSYQPTLSQQQIIIQYPINSNYSSNQIATAVKDYQYIQQPSPHNRILNHQPNLNNQNSNISTQTDNYVLNYNNDNNSLFVNQDRYSFM
ncbi:1791_t:CDS:2 [Diversispora eburnea]|uniref:1791_t:CDS:1 n=1 Tax=Diversispora eburnea TaxID=1213867 RepID=A0A9N9BQT4_9GLOM|nr:1791_t:CDS:2 [Diversispora eburnea]